MFYKPARGKGRSGQENGKYRSQRDYRFSYNILCDSVVHFNCVLIIDKNNIAFRSTRGDRFRAVGIGFKTKEYT